jgi:hypothetical protein
VPANGVAYRRGKFTAANWTRIRQLWGCNKRGKDAGRSHEGQRGRLMAQRPQPPWWWRSEVLGRLAMTLLAAVAAVYLARLLTPYL